MQHLFCYGTKIEKKNHNLVSHFIDKITHQALEVIFLQAINFGSPRFKGETIFTIFAVIFQVLIDFYGVYFIIAY